MKKILNIVLGEISTGELSISVAFEKSINMDKYNCHYLIPEDKNKILEGYVSEGIFRISRNKKPRENRTLITELLEKEKFDLIILFDIFTFEYAQDWTGVNCELLMETNIPIISLDEYEYTKAGYSLDYYGIFIKKLPPLLESCDFIIKNCPMSMIDAAGSCLRQGEGRNEYYYRIFDGLKRLESHEKKRIRRKYATVDEKEKVVLLTTSQWEVKGAYSFSCQNRLAEYLGPILYEYLNDLNEKIVMVHVGSENWKIEDAGRRVRYQHYDSLPVDKFEGLLQSVDLYVTFNLVSITLSKAVMFGVPSMVLNNGKILDFERLWQKVKERPAWYQQMASDVKKVYPFTASLFGWNNFLKKVIENNGYVDTFQKAEIFNYHDMKEALQKMLFDEKHRENILKENEKFINNYLCLLSADEVLEDIFVRLKEIA